MSDVGARYDLGAALEVDIGVWELSADPPDFVACIVTAGDDLRVTLLTPSGAGDLGPVAGQLHDRFGVLNVPNVSIFVTATAHQIHAVGTEAGFNVECAVLVTDVALLRYCVIRRDVEAVNYVIHAANVHPHPRIVDDQICVTVFG